MLSSENRAKTLLGITSGTHLAFSFFIYTVLVKTFPVGRASDAFLGSLVIPRILINVAGIPIMYASTVILARDGQAFQNVSIYRLSGFLLAVFGAIAALWIFAAPFCLEWILKGLDNETTALAVRLSRIQAITIPAGVIATFLYGVRQARGQTLRSESALLFETAVTLTLLLSIVGKSDMILATVLMAFRPFIQIAALIPIRRERPGNGPGPAVVFRGAPSLVAASAYQWIQQMVDRFLSSLTPSGGFTLYFVAQQAWGGAAEIVHRSVSAPAIPRLSVNAVDDLPGFRRDVKNCLVTSSAVALLISAGAIALGLESRRILAFIPSAVPGVADKFVLIASVTVGMFLGLVIETGITRAVVAMGWTSRLSTARAIMSTVGICFKTIGLSVGGLLGLGIAASLQNMATAAVLFVAYLRWMSKADKERLLKDQPA